MGNHTRLLGESRRRTVDQAAEYKGTKQQELKVLIHNHIYDLVGMSEAHMGYSLLRKDR